MNSTCTNWRLGAVIVRGGKIISSGYNRYSAKMEKFSRKYNLRHLFSLHAEMDAILNAAGNIDDAIMFIAGIKHNGNEVYCRPCYNCLKIIRHTKIRAIYYQAKNDIEVIIL